MPVVSVAWVVWVAGPAVRVAMPGGLARVVPVEPAGLARPGLSGRRGLRAMREMRWPETAVQGTWVRTVGSAVRADTAVRVVTAGRCSAMVGPAVSAVLVVLVVRARRAVSAVPAATV